MDPAKIAAVSSWPVPKDLHEMRNYLGLTNYFRKFVQGYATRCRSLTNLTRKSVLFVWTAECNAAFNGLKQDLNHRTGAGLSRQQQCAD